MTLAIFDGIEFDPDDFRRFGYLDPVEVGGVVYPRWMALLVAAGRDLGRALNTESISEIEIGTGSRTFVMAPERPIAVGAWVMVVSKANPATRSMYGQVTARAGDGLTVMVTIAVGEGNTAADWAISISAPLTTLNVDVQAALGAAAQAESARDAALVGNDFFANTAAGLDAETGVAEGETFRVLAGDAKSFTLYRHEAGPVATAIASFATKLLIDEALNELSGARQGAETVGANLTAIKADVVGVRDAVTFTGFTGVEEPGPGTNASARTIVWDDVALYDRTCKQVTIFNNSGASRVVRLRRMGDPGGADLDAADDNVDIDLTVPAADPPQALALGTPLLLRAGERPGMAIDHNAFTQTTPGAGLGTPFFMAVGNVQSVPKSSRRDDIAIQVRFDWSESVIDGTDYRAQRETIARTDAELALLKADVYKPVVIGNPQAFTDGSPIFGGSIAFKRLATKRRRITHMVTRNDTAADRAVIVQRQRVAGSNLVKVPGTTDIPLTIPANPSGNDVAIVPLGDASFVQEIGETLRVATIGVTGWTTYVSGPGDEDGILYVPGDPVDTIPLDSTSFDSIRLMLRFEGFEVAWSNQPVVDPGDQVEPYRVISVHTTDLIKIWGDSFSEGYASLLGKHYPEKLQNWIQWPVAVFALSGSYASSRLAALRANTAMPWAALGPQDYGGTDHFLVFGRNDRIYKTPEQFAEDIRRLKESIEGMGGRLHIVCEMADQWSSVSNSVNTGIGDEMVLYSVAKRLGLGFINVMDIGRRLGRGPGNVKFYAGSHPGVRTNCPYVQGIQRYIEENLGGPREAMLIFRPRPGRPASPAGGLFQDTYTRAQRWIPIQMGMITLENQLYYDALDSYPLNQVPVDSELLKLKAGQPIPFEDEALFHLTLRTEAPHVTEAIWVMNDVGANVYVPANLGGTVADYTSVGEWVQVAGSGGVYPIPLAVLRKAMSRDKLPIRIVRAGSFSLTDACTLLYKTDGIDKLPPRLKPPRQIAQGPELLTNTTFPTSGAPDGWTVTGGVVGQTTADAVDGGSHLPLGAVGVVELGPTKSITAEDVPYEEKSIGVPAQVRVTCRRWVPIFSPSSPDPAPVTSTSFDYRKVRVTLTYGSISVTQWAPVDIGWEDVYFDVLLPAGASAVDLKVDADDVVHVTEVSFKPMAA